MVDPVEGPGGPQQFERFMELLPEVQQKMMEFMEPETLSNLRGTSEEMRAQVDAYLEYLIISGKLKDREGNTVRREVYESGMLQPSEVLENWGNNYLRLDYQPPSAADVAELVRSWDEQFWRFEEYEEGGFNSLSYYEFVLDQTNVEAQRLQDELDYYVESLLSAGRLIDGTGAPLRTNTSLREVMELLRNGDATWLPPPNA